MTVFINVKIPNLKEFSNPIPLNVKKDVSKNKEITKMTIVKKYLFISEKLKLILEKINLFIKTFLGLLKDRIWLSENLVKE